MDQQVAGSDRLSQSIHSPASIDTGIFRQTLHYIQGHKSKVVGLSESASRPDGDVIVEPFHLHCSIGDRDETTLEMSALTCNDNEAIIFSLSRQYT